MNDVDIVPTNPEPFARAPKTVQLPPA